VTGGVVVVAHVSDTHLGAHVPSAVDTLPADVAAVAPDLTVVTGDCTMRARTGQFRQARTLLDRLPSPLMVVLGNHDVPLFSVARLVAPYARYRMEIEPRLDLDVEVAGLRALGLESMPRWRWKAGRVSRRQVDLVRTVLGDAPPGVARLLALHHPPLVGGLDRIVGRDALARALADARVDVVLAGHTHQPSIRTVDLTGTDPEATHRLVEVVAGTATSRRVRGTARSWTVIRVDPAAIAVEERYERDGTWCAGRSVRYARQQV
jgi:3',5'-cyclic AMP phosphodiesterase CpdA